MMWLARVLLLLGLVGLLAGSSGVQRWAEQRSAGFAGRQGFRALWSSLSTPWRPDRPNSYTPADAVVVGVGPLAAFLAAHLAFSSLLSPSHVVLVGALLACFLGALLMLNRDRPVFPLLAAMGGPLLLAALLLLGVFAIRGPLYFWYHFWTSDGFRTLLFTVGAGTFGWLLFALYAALRVEGGYPPPAAVGQLLVMLGVPLFGLGALLQTVGLERMLTRLNDELAVLPMGLSRILGITTHLNLPPNLPQVVLALGAMLSLCGLLLFAVSPRLSRSAAAPPQEGTELEEREEMGAGA